MTRTRRGIRSLYKLEGAFTARAGSGIEAGSITIHPSGFVHGPQPGSWERSVDQDRTDELAVMLDTFFEPLEITAQGLACADKDYPLSWHKAGSGSTSA